MFIEEFPELQFRIVICTVATSIDSNQMSLRILCISRHLLGCIYAWKRQATYPLTYSAGKVGLVKDTSTQVITTIYIVTYIGETF